MAAGRNDSFTVAVNSCGSVEFVDNGTWKGVRYDDFFLVHDYCADGYATEAIISLVTPDHSGDSPANRFYNTNGAAGDAAFVRLWNLHDGDKINVMSCLVSGPLHVEQACSKAVTKTVDG